MEMKKFPDWIFTMKFGYMYAFKNLHCLEGFDVAIRVGFDGVVAFGKNGENPNFHVMNPYNFALIEDFIGSQGEGFKPFEIGCVRRDGNGFWFADCIYKPGLIEEDFIELKSLLFTFHQEYKESFIKHIAN